MHPREYAAWGRHLRRYPPGDFLAQNILSKIASMLASFLSGKYVPPSEFAPWIGWRVDFHKAEEAEDQTIYRYLGAMMDAKDREEANG